jgi:diadenosine tetraphosphate (Ap4A) HIT family hydrolase
VSADCFPCRMTATLADQPPRERILVQGGWRVAHAFGSSLPGWLVALPLRHVTRMTELSPDEALALGPLLTAASAALETVTGCVKTYVVLFAEEIQHVHFHVVPRMADFDADVVGPGVFGLLGRQASEQVPPEEADRLAEAVRIELEARL